MSRLAILTAGLVATLACAPVYPDPDTGLDTGAPTTTGPTGTSTDPDTHDTDPVDTDTADTDTAPAVQDITGDWISEGANIAPLFAGEPFNWVQATATFQSNGTYTANALDKNGADYPVSGVYTVDTSTLPGTIVLNQDEPTPATAEGIWEVSGDTLTYEVVQTVPDYGLVPPTPSTGFGSSGGAGLTEGQVVQVYVRP